MQARGGGKGRQKGCLSVKKRLEQVKEGFAHLQGGCIDQATVKNSAADGGAVDATVARCESGSVQ